MQKLILVRAMKNPNCGQQWTKKFFQDRVDPAKRALQMGARLSKKNQLTKWETRQYYQEI